MKIKHNKEKLVMKFVQTLNLNLHSNLPKKKLLFASIIALQK